MRLRTKWWLCLVFGLSAAACGDSKSDGSGDAGGSKEDSAGGHAQSTGGAGSGQAGKTGSSSSGSQAGRRAPSDEDAGVSSGGGGSGGKPSSGAAGSSTPTSTSQAFPSDGNQLSICSMAQGDCNKGLACHAPANALSPGRGYCSKICKEDADCSGLSPSSAKYSCSAGGGTRSCELACSGSDDTSCPAGLKCVETSAAMSGRGSGRGGAGAGGSAGTPAQFGCRYPFETSAAWGPCNDGVHACGDKLSCSSSTRAGHCLQGCEMDGDCAKPTSGSITPSCAAVTAARGMSETVKQCVLDCSAASDGCPTDTKCVDGPRTGMGMDQKPAYQRCE